MGNKRGGGMGRLTRIALVAAIGTLLIAVLGSALSTASPTGAAAGAAAKKKAKCKKAKAAKKKKKARCKKAKKPAADPFPPLNLPPPLLTCPTGTVSGSQPAKVTGIGDNGQVHWRTWDGSKFVDHPADFSEVGPQFRDPATNTWT